jgi:hypothetical protein
MLSDGRRRALRDLSRTVLTAAAILILAAAATACVGPEGRATAPASASAAPPAAVDREHAQALAALERWAAAVDARGGASSFVPVGELTAQIGDWEEGIGENNKLALISGVVELGTELPDDTPDAVVTWDDGSTETVRTVSASTAFAALRASPQPCPECVPLVVTGARRSHASFETNRGPATAPTWEFALQGTRVIVSRLAVDIGDAVTVVPPPWDPNNPPVGMRIERATRSADDRQLTVEFVGSPETGDKACGADYTAEAVESDKAVVVIVTAHGGQPGAACNLAGAPRTAVVRLAEPLGDRAVLEMMEGLPVPVEAAP